MANKIKKAVIPVAGFGTRFLPETKAIPKEMLPVVDKPVVQYLVEEAVAAGIDTVIFVTNKNKHSVQSHFSRDRDFEAMLKRAKKFELLDKVKEIHNLADFLYVCQDEPLGSGDAVMRAQGIVQDEPFAVFYADDIVESVKPAIGQLIEVYDNYRTSVLGLFKVPKSEVNLYGIADGEYVSERTLLVRDLVEKPDPKSTPSQLASVGRFILTPDIFSKIAKTKKTKGEVYLADAIDDLCNEGKVYGYELEGKWYDCGSKAGFLRANIEVALKRTDMKKDMQNILKDLR
ncbi:MAG: hypothetical protein A3B96_01395 [Candidatus Spechtbacteria bacterium RIFCSPHIGHO2_02_FULL_43_15b]|uniref:UTP--glucose-1-phosphate uridylyltransferase n=1 Tax=Candidatus Spechtbacteria bacterium RIFCSPHIGHO2_01_FULL_43_30 TaxID=1802158 RepID=A0A1G2H672_9BACT|nr:MAG: hypothetical protein A2827_00315 [Candidatus Spechtbacteria bacterium RIFCSPHIGHO2_01_FULL_43_30]OGZ59065.1 MAG: hypothetical protein A3B96_01395 [Candidatus Spechtbacteria bacterium RIFCSPHIGHO2_02_FULL_43_15b]